MRTPSTAEPHDGDQASLLTRAEGANEPLHLDQPNLRPGDVARGRPASAIDDEDAAAERRAMVRALDEDAPPESQDGA